MGLKVAVVGGGSTYTPELVEGFARRAAVLPIDELSCWNPDAERLEVVGGLAGRILAREQWPGRLTLTGDRSAALDGASFTLVQLRVGGQAARLVDETLPHRFGAIGQETTGPGIRKGAPDRAGRAGDRRGVGAPRRAGVVAARLHQPGGHRHPGAARCRVPRDGAVQRRDRVPAVVRPPFDVTADRVRLDHVGLNHLSWIRHVWVDGVDRLPELLDAGDPP